jgi:hypothetical protein
VVDFLEDPLEGQQILSNPVINLHEYVSSPSRKI